MPSPMFISAVVLSQLAATAAFLSATPPSSAPRVAPHFTSLTHSGTGASCRPAARLELSHGMSPRRQQSSAADRTVSSSPLTLRARCDDLEHLLEQPENGTLMTTALEENISAGLSEQQQGRFPSARLGTRRATSARLAALTASALAAGLVATVFSPGVASAAVEMVVESEVVEHLHVGQKVANFFRRGGLPDWATLMTISAMPVVELRGGIPVGIWMGMPIAKVLGLCVAGNMIPIPIILLALRYLGFRGDHRYFNL